MNGEKMIKEGNKELNKKKVNEEEMIKKKKQWIKQKKEMNEEEIIKEKKEQGREQKGDGWWRRNNKEIKTFLLISSFIFVHLFLHSTK